MARTKEAAKLIKAVRKAGGEVDDSGTGKITVTGPKGTAHIGDNLQGRHWKIAVNAIARDAGIEINE